MRLSSHSLSTSLTSPWLEFHSPSNFIKPFLASDAGSLTILGLGIFESSASRSRPKPTGLSSFNVTSEALLDGRTGLTVKTSSSSDSGNSGAVLNESARDDGYLSVAKGRNVIVCCDVVLGGVTSGVGGLRCAGGVLGAMTCTGVLIRRSCVGITCATATVLPADECREWLGGVGGRSMIPVFREACFDIPGLEVCELEEVVERAVSVPRGFGFDEGRDVLKSLRLSSDACCGCGSTLCLFNDPRPAPRGRGPDVSSC